MRWSALLIFAIAVPACREPERLATTMALPVPELSPPEPDDRLALWQLEEMAAAHALWWERSRARDRSLTLLESEARALLADAERIDRALLAGDDLTRFELVLHQLELAVAWFELRDTWKKLKRPAPLAGVEGGARAYRYFLREHTSRELSPEAVRRIGETELEAIEGEIVALAARLGEPGEPSAIFRRLRRAPSPVELRAPTEATQARALAALPRAFSWSEVRAAPVHLRSGWVPPGFYVGSKRASRPGFHLSVGRTRLHVRDMEVLSVHETVPGHHYQHEAAAYAGHREPSFGTVTAFTEGWATYAERVADELGVYSSDEARLGMLCFQAWRASRILVDTGLHAFGWDEARARGYLRDHSCLSEAVIAQEIQRSLADPGRGTAYTVGARAIARLRARAERALGERFELAAFHRTVLAWGDVPLATLERRVLEWVREQASSPRGPGAAMAW